MALDKVVDSAVLDAGMTAVADAIRAKAGTTEPLAWPDGFKAAIEAISGGGGTGLAYDMGEFVLDADTSSNNPWLISNPIPHNLGETPDFIIVWTDHWAGITEAPYTDTTTMVGFAWLNGLTGMIGRASASVDVTNPLIAILSFPKSDYRCSVSNPTSAAYGLTNDRLPTQEAFALANYGASSLWRAGVVYKYFVSKAWWNIGGVANAE